MTASAARPPDTEKSQAVTPPPKTAPRVQRSSRMAKVCPRPSR